jgi:hypothetical protein
MDVLGEDISTRAEAIAARAIYLGVALQQKNSFDRSID